MQQPAKLTVYRKRPSVKNGNKKIIHVPNDRFRKKRPRKTSWIPENKPLTPEKRPNAYGKSPKIAMQLPSSESYYSSV